ncbi:MAG: hypothetical protein ACPG52_05810 [Cognaticolwellia sp.]
MSDIIVLDKKEQFSEVYEQINELLPEGVPPKELTEELVNFLQKNTTLNVDETRLTVEKISSTIDLINHNFASLQQSKEQGKSRTSWLVERLEETISKYDIDNKNELISEIKDSLQLANNKIGENVFDSTLGDLSPLFSNSFDDINKIAIVKNLQEEIQTNTLLGAVIIENGAVVLNENITEVKAVKEYFEAELDSSKDALFKKAITTLTILAQKQNLISLGNSSDTPEELSMMVDKGVTQAKVAYKLGKGELSPIDAIEYTVDRNVVILNSAITTTCSRVGGKIGAKLGAIVGSVFGPSGTLIAGRIGDVIGKKAGYVVGKYVGEGVKKVATVAKSVATNAWNSVKSTVSNVTSKVKSWFGF